MEIRDSRIWYNQKEKEILVSAEEELWFSVDKRLQELYPWMRRSKRHKIADIARGAASYMREDIDIKRFKK